MKILVVNAGSSSLKYQLLDMETETVLASGLVERIGDPMGAIKYVARPGSPLESKEAFEQPVADHKAAMRLSVDLLTSPDKGVIKSKDDISALGHRIVHGGERFSQSVLVDESVIKGIREAVPLAPLHNPGHLQGIEVALELFPNAPQVVVFDTAFHQTMPEKAYMYALPYEMYEKYKVRKYGAHGTSHRYVSRRAAQLLEKPYDEANIIVCHLGNGSSISAVQGGKCVDTSMGLTPTGGVIMGTRTGDMDPCVVTFIGQNAGLDVDSLANLVTKESGFKGICGYNDMRDIHARAEKGDARARMALEMAAYRVRNFLGSYFFTLGSVDAVVFTAGIGENDDVFREMCCKNLENFGIVFDVDKNRNLRGGDHVISAPDSPTAVYIISTNEELEIARETSRLLDPEAKRP